MSNHLEAPEELYLAGSPAMGCDTWQWVQRVEPNEPSLPAAVHHDAVTAPVRYLRADFALPAATVEQVLRGLLVECTGNVSPPTDYFRGVNAERSKIQARIRVAAARLGFSL